MDLVSIQGHSGKAEERGRERERKREGEREREREGERGSLISSEFIIVIVCSTDCSRQTL